MRSLLSVVLLTGSVLTNTAATAAPDAELVYKLKASVVKVHATTKNGGHGVGTGVVVAPDVVATNCHILSQAEGVHISKMGDSFSPTSMQADWAHDVCLLRFQYLNLPATATRAASTLQYNEAVFSIGFPGGPPKPQTSAGVVRALYPLENSVVVRSDAAFIMGASGSPLFDSEGHLVAMSTFKSPGRHAYFYSVPVEWIERLLDQPASGNPAAQSTAFWDLPLSQRPYFMQVVQPYLQGDWADLQTIAAAWTQQSPQTAEAWFYLASARHGLGELKLAQQAYERAVQLQPAHSDAWQGLAILAQQSGQSTLLENASTQLKTKDSVAWQVLQERLKELQ